MTLTFFDFLLLTLFEITTGDAGRYLPLFGQNDQSILPFLS
jgi:hypothetical protein